MTPTAFALVFGAALLFAYACFHAPGFLVRIYRREHRSYMSPDLQRSVDRSADARARREA